MHRDRRLHLIIAGRLRLAAAARRAGCRRTVLPRLTAGMPRAGRCVLRIPAGAAFRSGLPRHPAAGLAGLLLRIFLSARRTACSRGTFRRLVFCRFAFRFVFFHRIPPNFSLQAFLYTCRIHSSLSYVPLTGFRVARTRSFPGLGALSPPEKARPGPVKITHNGSYIYYRRIPPGCQTCQIPAKQV